MRGHLVTPTSYERWPSPPASRLKASVTLAYSERDWSRPAERDHVARQLDVAAITVPGTGHFSALERPAKMLRIIRQGAAARP